jgi:hypothetical protein
MSHISTAQRAIDAFHALVYDPTYSNEKGELTVKMLEREADVYKLIELLWKLYIRKPYDIPVAYKSTEEKSQKRLVELCRCIVFTMQNVCKTGGVM